MARIQESLSYDDVLLVPNRSSVLPNQTDLKTDIGGKLVLNAPIISAAMDRVTEIDMAVTLSRIGGIGIIHKNQSISNQAEMVRQVKRSESGIISDPFTLKPTDLIELARDLMAQHGVSGFPVVNRDSKLVGILTNRDLRAAREQGMLVKDVMTSKVVTASADVNPDQAMIIMHKNRVEKLPIVDGNRLVGLITLKDITNIKNYPNSSKDQSGSLLCGAAVGVGEAGIERARALVEAGVDMLVLDSAHGHSEGILESTYKLNQKYPNTVLVVGNVATQKGAEDCIKHGADVIKVGIGPGSICTTRIVAGIGVPQFSAVMDCAKIAKKYDVPVIADGGIKSSGDIVKALAGGANAVMLGNLLSGTDESPGESVLANGRRYKEYRGMGSREAMKQGSADRYFQDKSSKLTPEGVSGLVPYKGSVTEILDQLIGGLRSGMGYCGAKNIRDLQKKANFIRQTPSGFRESHVHDLETIYESPNYQQPD